MVNLKFNYICHLFGLFIHQIVVHQDFPGMFVDDDFLSLRNFHLLLWRNGEE